MSISDELMWSYYELLTDFPSPVIVRLREEVRTGVLHPMEAKMQLAHTIIAGFHGEEAAQKARDEFQRVFRERQAPEEAPRHKISRGAPKRLSALLVDLKLAPSRSEAERLMKQGGVEIDGGRADDVKKEIDLSKAGEFLLRAGKKKFVRVVVE
jgi:tyrosyl-tRNA synthetase